MKKVFMLLALIGLMSISLFSQSVNIVHLKNGSAIKGAITIANDTLSIETADGSVFFYPMNEVKSIDKIEPKKNEQTKRVVSTSQHSVEPTPVVEKKKDTEFSIRGGIFANLEHWNGLTLKEDESKFGVGVSGILSAGVDFNTTGIFIGAGPGLGAHYWWITKSITVSGHTNTATADITTVDFDMNVVFGIDDMFATVGKGSSSINVGASVNDDRTTVKLTDSAPYTKIMFGFHDFMTWGITFMQYSAPYKGMNRIELNLGF